MAPPDCRDWSVCRTFSPLMALRHEEVSQRIGWMAPISSWDCRWRCSVRVLDMLGHGLRKPGLVVCEASLADVRLGYRLHDARSARVAVRGARTCLARALDVLALHAAVCVAVRSQVGLLYPHAAELGRSCCRSGFCWRSRIAEDHLGIVPLPPRSRRCLDLGQGLAAPPRLLGEAVQGPGGHRAVLVPTMNVLACLL